MHGGYLIKEIKQQNSLQYETDFELAHIIGFNNKTSKCVQAHPIMSDTVIYAVGGTVIVEDLNEKNNQIFFRHALNQISCIRLSNNGKFIAVGFISQILEKKLPTSIILWEFETKTIIYEFTGITKGVSIIEFSPDDRFISGNYIKFINP